MFQKLAMRAAAMALLAATQAVAQTQTTPGAGNAAAVAIASKSQMVHSTMEFLVDQAMSITDSKLRSETLDAITNPSTCVQHRAGVDDATKNAILQKLIAERRVNVADDATFPGGLKAGVFPPLVNDGSACPQLPQPFFSAPGSVFHDHYSYPGESRRPSCPRIQ